MLLLLAQVNEESGVVRHWLSCEALEGRRQGSLLYCADCVCVPLCQYHDAGSDDRAGEGGREGGRRKNPSLIILHTRLLHTQPCSSTAHTQRSLSVPAVAGWGDREEGERTCGRCRWESEPQRSPSRDYCNCCHWWSRLYSDSVTLIECTLSHYHTITPCTTAHHHSMMEYISTVFTYMYIQ